VQHPNGLFSSYNHLEKALVKVGDKVTGGQVVALSDSTGKSSGDHLHFAVFTALQDVQVGARGKNPLCLFPESIKSGLIITGINCKPPFPNPTTNGC
jgi:murein DD-endopeptidase MepM/ murein hydrolase activator NlpD